MNVFGVIVFAFAVLGVLSAVKMVKDKINERRSSVKDKNREEKENKRL